MQNLHKYRFPVATKRYPVRRFFLRDKTFSFLQGCPKQPGFIVGQYTTYKDFHCAGSFFKKNVHYSAGDSLILGSFINIAHGAHFILNGAHHSIDAITTTHFSNKLWRCEGATTFPGYRGPTIVADDVWIGYNAAIMPGVYIGEGAVVAAHSVVTKDVPPFAIVAGVPARVKRFRFDEKTIAQLLRIRWWDWPASLVVKHIPLLRKPDLTVLKEMETLSRDIFPQPEQTLRCGLVIIARGAPGDLKACLRMIRKQTQQPNEIVVMTRYTQDEIVKMGADIDGIIWHKLADKEDAYKSVAVGLFTQKNEVFCFVEDSCLLKADCIASMQHALASDPKVSAVYGNVEIGHMVWYRRWFNKLFCMPNNMVSGVIAVREDAFYQAANLLKFEKVAMAWSNYELHRSLDSIGMTTYVPRAQWQHINALHTLRIGRGRPPIAVLLFTAGYTAHGFFKRLVYWWVMMGFLLEAVGRLVLRRQRSYLAQWWQAVRGV